MKTRILAACLVWLGLTSAALPASAGFIEGALTIAGDFAPTGGDSLSDATGISFPGNDFHVYGASFDFADAGIGPGSLGAIADFAFSDLDGGSIDLWSIAGFTFNLQTIRVVLQNSQILVATGRGSVSGNGFDPTMGSWNITANSLGGLFSFSSGTSVPVPATLLLFGLGFAGLMAARRGRG